MAAGGVLDKVSRDSNRAARGNQPERGQRRLRPVQVQLRLQIPSRPPRPVGGGARQALNLAAYFPPSQGSRVSCAKSARWSQSALSSAGQSGSRGSGPDGFVGKIPMFLNFERANQLRPSPLVHADSKDAKRASRGQWLRSRSGCLSTWSVESRQALVRVGSRLSKGSAFGKRSGLCRTVTDPVHHRRQLTM